MLEGGVQPLAGSMWFGLLEAGVPVLMRVPAVRKRRDVRLHGAREIAPRHRGRAEISGDWL